MDINIETNKSNKLSIPLAIVFAGILIAGAVLYTGREGNNGVAKQVVVEGDSTLDAIRPVGVEDHIRGNPNAEVFVIEYSDTECPFCKQFHKTMKQVVDEYGDKGKVAWVYRHFPLDQLHSKARNEAVALECANELGGNEAFWKYTDRIYEITPANNGLDPTKLPIIAEFVGLDVQKFNTCLASSKYNKKIEDDLLNANLIGGKGTPWSVVVHKKGKKYPLSGAQPISSVKQIIQTALKN